MTRNLIAKVWSLCDLLRDDGITYQDYLTEISWLLYIRLSGQVSAEHANAIMARIWHDLSSAPANEILSIYKSRLESLARSPDFTTRSVFADAATHISNPEVLIALVRGIDKIAWEDLGAYALGDIYEGILERNAVEQKSGAGQYFTPRTIVELMVRAIAPVRGESVQDPAAGTGGFLVAAAAHMAEHSDKTENSNNVNFYGIELVPGTFRLCLMNLSLHGVRANVILGNALGPRSLEIPRPDIILTNPPFGARRGAGMIDRPDLSFQTSNKQLAFLQHTYQVLKPGGRAAIVVPDGVLFDGGVAREIRRQLLRTCDVHTVLRLPIGLFYAQAVKTNILFFQKPKAKQGDGGNATKATWVYDARTDVSARTSAAKLAALFADFEQLYPHQARVHSMHTKGHVRMGSFSRAQLAEFDDRLDIPVFKPTRMEGNLDPSKSLHDMRTALIEALEITTRLEATLSNGRA